MIEGQLVGLLTVEQKNDLVGVEYMPDTYYNPVQDNDDNWIKLNYLIFCDYFKILISGN